MDIDKRLLALIGTAKEGDDPGYEVIDGVVQHIDMPFAGFLAHAPELYSLAPIRHLTLRGGDAADLRKLFGSADMARLRSIDVHEVAVTDAELEILALSPHPTDLRWLSFRSGTATFAGIRVMAESLSLKRLVYFDPGWGSEDPRKSYYTDWDGSIADSHFPENGERLERWYGPVPWLQPKGPDIPNRFEI